MNMGLTTSGIIFMTAAWGCIFTLTIYCFFKVLKTNKK